MRGADHQLGSDSGTHDLKFAVLLPTAGGAGTQALSVFL